MDTVELAYDVYETWDTQRDKCPIIFLHGLFWNKFMLQEVAEDLCQTTKRKVFCLDLRCHDKSPFRPDCTTELMAADIRRFIRDRGLQRVSFVCHSMSCTVAYLVTIDEPQLVEKLVMIDHLPFAVYTEAWYNENVLPQFVSQNRFLKSLDPTMSLVAAKRKILDLSHAADTKGQRKFLQKVAYDLTKVNNQFTWKTEHTFLIEGYCKNFRVSPRGCTDHEILVVRCQNSGRVTDDKFEKSLKYNSNMKLVTIKDCTHLLMFEKQEEFLEVVKDFFF